MAPTATELRTELTFSDREFPRHLKKITYRVGYEDSSSFRKVFIKKTGLRPTEYRKKFQRV